MSKQPKERLFIKFNKKIIHLGAGKNPIRALKNAKKNHNEEHIVVDKIYRKSTQHKKYKNLFYVKGDNVEILKQGQNAPLPVEQQVAIIYLGAKGLINDVPVEKVREFEAEFLSFLVNSHQGVLDSLRAGKLDESSTDTLEKVAQELTVKYKN